MVDFIDEVNEDLHREKLNRFWQRVGAYVVAASVAIILATVASVLWQKHVASRQAEATEAFLAANKTMKTNDYDSAARQFGAVAAKDAQGVPALAALKEAYTLAKAGEKEKALAVYRKITEDHAADKGIRDISRIYAAQLMADSGKPLAEITEVLQPVTGDRENPFSPVAREQLAYASLQNGDTATAHRLLVELSTDMTAPLTLRNRAQAQAAGMAVETAVAKTEAVETEAEPQAAAVE